MPNLIKFGSTSNLIRFTIKNKTTGLGLTGLSGSTTGLIISTICDVEASPTVYTQSGSTIQTIATLGTYAAPSASNCRFGQVSATNHPGLYEFQFADARFSVSSSKRLVVSVNDGENTILDDDYEIILTQFDPFDSVHLGLTSLPNTAVTTNASLLTSGTGTDQLSVSSGKVILQATQTGVTIPTVTTVTNQLTAAAIATGIFQDSTAGDFTVAGSIGKSLFTGGVVPGAAGGLFIAGTNAATTITTSLTTTFTGNLTGSVGSISGVTFPTNFSSLSIDVSGRIDLGKVLGTASAGTAGYVGIDWGHINAPTTTVGLTGTTIGTITTYTGDTPQTGDSYARIGSNGSGLTSLAQASTALSVATAIPTTGNTANTLADCLNAARAQGFGKWTIVGTTLNLYASDGLTVVKSFTLDSATAPTQRI